MADQISLEVVLKRLNEIEKLYNGLAKASKSSDEVVSSTSKIGKQINKAVTEAQKLQAALANVSNGLSLGQLEKIASKGNPITALKRSFQNGESKDIEASYDAMFTRIANKARTTMAQVVKAAGSREVVGLASKRQEVPASTLIAVNKQIEAQQYRVANAEVRAAQLFGTNQKAKLTFIANEKTALDGLLVQKNKLLGIEKELAVQTSRANKVQNLLGDGGASLFKIQAGLLVNYGVMTQIFKLFQFGTQYVIQYDKALRDLQAVTESTNKTMDSLSKTFIEVSTNTKFTAVELAQAAITLGQAGLSAAEIDKSIASVALLATATGSDLATSVDVVTSALTIFNLNAAETAHVADVMTGALNLSKLTMDKLQLGIQYAGNAAAESGITLEELTAALGAMSNAGIKSGSTLGTGLTQIIVELQNPTKKLATQLKQVGLTFADVDIKANGLIPVIETMKKAGFGASDAFASMDLRAARAYLALSRNTEAAREMETSFQLSSAASKAQETQMRSLANSGQKLSDTFGALLLQIGEPFKQALITLANLLAGVLKVLNEFPVMLQIVGTLLVSTFSAFAVAKVALLAKNLLGLGAAATTATGRLTRALNLLGLTGIGKLATIIALVVGSLVAYTSITNSASAKTDKLKTEMDEAKAAFDSTNDSIGSVDTEIDRLTSRYDSLSKNSAALRSEVIAMQTKFGQFTKDIRLDTINTVEDLIKVLKNLQGEMRNTALEKLRLLSLKSSENFSNNLAGDADKFTQSSFSKLYHRGKITEYIGTRDKYGQLADKTKGTNLTALTSDELIKLQNTFLNERQSQSNQLLDLQKQITDFTAKIQDSKTSDEQRGVLEHNLKILKDQRDKTQESYLAVQSRAAEIGNQIAFKNLESTQVVEAAKGVQKLNKQITEAATKLSSAKASGSTKAIAAAKKNVEDLKKKIETEVPNIVAETGESDATVRNVLNNTLTEKLNTVASEASSSYGKLTEGVDKANSKYLNEITKLQDISLGQIERDLTRATNEADTKIAKLNSIINQASDKKYGGLRGLYSDAEISMLEEKKRGIEDQKISIELDKRKQQQPLYDELVKQAEKEYNAVMKSKASYVDKKKAVDNYNEAQDKQIANAQKIAALEAEDAARKGIIVEKQASLTEQIQHTLEKYSEQISIQDSLGLNIEKNITDTLDNARESFGSFFKDWINGTATAGDAFRSFSLKVLEGLQDMAIKAATNSIFKGISGFAGDAIGAIAGTSSTQAAISQSIAANPAIFAGGGYVHKRAAAGMAVTTRDSVNALVRPGEYILRNSAVDMIGRENLDAINASGNRKINESGSRIPNMATSTKKSEPVNVYVVSPEAKPSLTKNDVLVTIQDDMARGGQTIQLIKQIMR